MTEEEIMKILDEMEDHYEALDKKNFEKGSKSEYGASMAIACRVLKRRIRTVFNTKTK